MYVPATGLFAPNFCRSVGEECNASIPPARNVFDLRVQVNVDAVKNGRYVTATVLIAPNFCRSVGEPCSASMLPTRNVFDLVGVVIQVNGITRTIVAITPSFCRSVGEECNADVCPARNVFDLAVGDAIQVNDDAVKNVRYVPAISGVPPCFCRSVDEPRNAGAPPARNVFDLRGVGAAIHVNDVAVRLDGIIYVSATFGPPPCFCRSVGEPCNASIPPARNVFDLVGDVIQVNDDAVRLDGIIYVSATFGVPPSFCRSVGEECNASVMAARDAFYAAASAGACGRTGRC